MFQYDFSYELSHAYVIHIPLNRQEKRMLFILFQYEFSHTALISQILLNGPENPIIFTLFQYEFS